MKRHAKSKATKRARQWARAFPFLPDSIREFTEYLALAFDAGYAAGQREPRKARR